jgi:Isopropylmalate/homocitrate/citramalate synthases
MNIKIVDTTLRDGEQKAGIALKIEDKIEIAKILDSIGTYQIEAGIPFYGWGRKKELTENHGIKLEK